MAQLTTGNGLPNVVVTGVAMTTALATDAENTWKKLLDGQSGIRTLEDPFIEEYGLPVRIGGHLLEDFEGELNKVENRISLSGHTDAQPFAGGDRGFRVQWKTPHIGHE